MKKTMCFILCILLNAIYCLSAYADDNLSFEYLEDFPDDYEAIIGMSAYIEDSLKNVISSEIGYNISEDLSIDLSTCMKVNLGYDLLQANSNEFQEVENFMGMDDYVWVYTMDYEGECYQITIAEGLPPNEDVDLTEEEYEWIKQREGKWDISEIAIREKDMFYDQIVEQKLADNDFTGSEVYFVGAITHIGMPAALVVNEDEIDYLIPMYPLEIEGTQEQIRSIMADGVQDLDEEIYDFSQMLEALKSIPEPDPDLSGGIGYIDLTAASEGSNNYFALVLLSIGVILICGTLLVKKNRRFPGK